MKAISVKQPWAYLLCAGIKDIENRTWRLPEKYKGERVFIHASGKPDKEPYMLFSDEQIKSIGDSRIMDVVESYETTSAIIGSVQFGNCVIDHSSIWAEKTPYLVELEKGVYLSDGDGDPSRALLAKNALKFKTRGEAHTAMLRATEYRPFENVKTVKDEPIYNWVATNPILFNEPIPCKGRLGFWEFDGKVVTKHGKSY